MKFQKKNNLIIFTKKLIFFSLKINETKKTKITERYLKKIDHITFKKKHKKPISNNEMFIKFK